MLSDTKVLIVDESRFSRSLLTPQLASYGAWDVDDCGDGVAGLQRLKDGDYDVVLVDYEVGALNRPEPRARYRGVNGVICHP